jgi:hypothetical protein
MSCAETLPEMPTSDSATVVQIDWSTKHLLVENIKSEYLVLSERSRSAHKIGQGYSEFCFLGSFVIPGP